MAWASTTPQRWGLAGVAALLVLGLLWAAARGVSGAPVGIAHGPTLGALRDAGWGDWLAEQTPGDAVDLALWRDLDLNASLAVFTSPGAQALPEVLEPPPDELRLLAKAAERDLGDLRGVAVAASRTRWWRCEQGSDRVVRAVVVDRISGAGLAWSPAVCAPANSRDAGW